MTDKYPDVLELIVALFDRAEKESHHKGPLDSFILDAEVCMSTPIFKVIVAIQGLDCAFCLRFVLLTQFRES